MNAQMLVAESESRYGLRRKSGRVGTCNTGHGPDHYGREGTEWL